MCMCCSDSCFGPLPNKSALSQAKIALGSTIKRKRHHNNFLPSTRHVLWELCDDILEL